MSHEPEVVCRGLLRKRKVKREHHSIAEHMDTDTDGDVDSSDKWFYNAFDEHGRHAARFRESDANPKEEFVHHQAALDGLDWASIASLLAFKSRDANTAWTSASDGTLEYRAYYCENWSGALSAIIQSTGSLREWIQYSAYSVPFCLPGGDTNSDGFCLSGDSTQIQSWASTLAYDVRGDINLDGAVTSTDQTLSQGAPYAGASGGYSVLSAIEYNRNSGEYSELIEAPNIWSDGPTPECSQLGRLLKRNRTNPQSPSNQYQMIADSISGRSDRDEPGILGETHNAVHIGGLFTNGLSGTGGGTKDPNPPLSSQMIPCGSCTATSQNSHGETDEGHSCFVAITVSASNPNPGSCASKLGLGVCSPSFPCTFDISIFISGSGAVGYTYMVNPSGAHIRLYRDAISGLGANHSYVGLVWCGDNYSVTYGAATLCGHQLITAEATLNLGCGSCPQH